jgi:Ca2+-binding RTX toxin-like protein
MSRRFGHGHRWHRDYDRDGGHHRWHGDHDRDGGHHRWRHHHADAGQRDGTDGDDRMYGRCGDDQLSGGDGDDWLFGGRGDDRLEGGAGNDQLFGGAGDDLFVYRAGDGHDHVHGGWGRDVLRLEGDWALDLDRGAVVGQEGGQVQLSCGAAGTITFGDGSTLRFDGLERIETVAPEPEPEPGNRAPSLVELAAGPVAEGAAAGTVVGSVVATDPDAGDTLTYALTDDADGRFAIDPATGVITVAEGASLDYETVAGHSIGVAVTDAEGLSAAADFTIQVADVNEAPVLLDLSNDKVIEGVPDGTVVGTVLAVDPDAGDSLTYALSDDADGRFAIDPGTGVITVADADGLDYATAAEHSIGVTVTDADGLSASATYAIEVLFDNSGDDVVRGDDGDNVIDGGPGDDRIEGLGGNDHLIGSDGDDELDGGTGDDVLEGGANNDLLVGDEGADQLDGGAGNDFVFGNDGDDQLFGGDGNDQLYGGPGDDQLDGGGGDDLLQAADGDDALRGGTGHDSLYGGAGADTLAGGAGDDMLFGGTETDRFVFTSIDDGVDEIVDFGTDDVLALGGMLVNFTGGDEAAFVRLVDNTTSTTLQVDPDGAANGVAFTSIAVLDGVTGISLTDLMDASQIDFWTS